MRLRNKRDLHYRCVVYAIEQAMRIARETLAHQGHIRYFKHSRSTRYWRVLTGSSARENSPSPLEHNNVTCLVESDGLPGPGKSRKMANLVARDPGRVLQAQQVLRWCKVVHDKTQKGGTTASGP
jgi:hypothetical protein